MTDTEIEAYRQRLNDLTLQLRDGKKDENTIRPQLIELAREVGASTKVLYVRFINSSTTSGEADTSELIKNIHQALQTATMVNMCKAATNGYEIATNASNMATKASKTASIQFWIATAINVIIAATAVISAIVALKAIS